MKQAFTSLFLLYFTLWLPLTIQREFCNCSQQPVKQTHSCCADKAQQTRNSSHCGKEHGQKPTGLLQGACQQACLSPDVVIEASTSYTHLVIPVVSNTVLPVYRPYAPLPGKTADFTSNIKPPPIYLISQTFRI